MIEIYDSTETKLKEVLAYMIDDWDRWRDVSSTLASVLNHVFDYQDPMNQVKVGYMLSHTRDYSDDYDEMAKEMHSKIMELAGIFGVKGDE